MPDTKSAYAQVFRVGGRCVCVVNLYLDFAGGPDHRVRQLTHLLNRLDDGLLPRTTRWTCCAATSTPAAHTDPRPPPPRHAASWMSRVRAVSRIHPRVWPGRATCSRASTRRIRPGDCCGWGRFCACDTGRSSTTFWSGARALLLPPRWSPRWSPSHELDSPGRVTVVDFAASWCVPCWKSLPHLEALAQSHPDIQFLVVSVDDREDGRDQLVGRLGLSLPVIWDGGHAIASAFGPKACPRPTCSAPTALFCTSTLATTAIRGARS